MMTRKHFKAIAEAVSLMKVDKTSRIIIAFALAETLKQFNPAFNKERFIDKCGEGDA